MTQGKTAALFFYCICIVLFAIPAVGFSQLGEPELSNEFIKQQPYYKSLKKALRNPEKVYKLDLINTGLREFPPDILKLTQLRFLLLDSNGIKELPENISALEKLQVLSLGNNNLQTLPSSIGKLHELYFLSFDNNQLKVLPSEFYNLYNLEQLYINNNKLSIFPPDFQKMKALRTLSMANNEIEKIPDEIGHLYDLERLSFSRNRIKDLPERFYELKNLESLYLSGNLLTGMAFHMENFSRLEILALDHNRLKNLPPQIGTLYRLKKIYLENNELDNIPPEMATLFDLKVLFIGNNPMLSIPVELGQLKKLEYLNVDSLTFSSFPQALYDIQNNGTQIAGLKSKELYTAKLLLSQARNRKLTGEKNEAIIKYKEYTKLDTNHTAAMSELAALLLDSGEYDEAAAICKKALAKDATAEISDELRTTYTNSLNKTNKYDLIINSFNAKIKEQPGNAQPHFELGKFYYDQAKYDEAEKCFQNAVTTDPSYGNSHIFLSIINYRKDQKDAFVFSALQFLSLQPNTKKAKTLLPFLFKTMRMKLGIPGKGGKVHYYDSYIIRDENNEILYKTEDPSVDILSAMIMELATSNISVKDSSGEDSELIKGVLEDVLYTKKNNVEIFQAELKKICENSDDSSSTIGEFASIYYLPYYNALIESGHLETFAYIINDLRRKEDYITDWLKNNTSKVEKFDAWRKNYNWNQK